MVQIKRSCLWTYTLKSKRKSSDIFGVKSHAIRRHGQWAHAQSSSNWRCILGPVVAARPLRRQQQCWIVYISSRLRISRNEARLLTDKVLLVPFVFVQHPTTLARLQLHKRQSQQPRNPASADRVYTKSLPTTVTRGFHTALGCRPGLQRQRLPWLNCTAASVVTHGDNACHRALTYKQFSSL